MLNQFLDFCSANIEWVLPLALVLLEVIIMRIPTKDPAGLVERVGRILRLVLESRVKNNRKNFQNKVVEPHNKEKLK